MSQKYTGGFITKSPVAPTSSAASGIWTLDQQQQAKQAGNWPSPPIFIEDLFSTYLYTGTGAAQTITNGIDLSTNGGLVWQKSRTAAQFNGLVDTVRGVSSCLVSSSTGAVNTVAATGISAFNSNGFTQNTNGDFNTSTYNYVSWTFREQPKFFDIVTYTGTGSNTTIAHSLGSVPGFIIVKRTDTTGNWICYHRSLNTTAGGIVVLNLSTYGELTDASCFNSTAPTSSVFTVGTSAETNGSGGTFVAYIYAHDAGGFPVSGGGSTNGISCGSYTTDGAGVGSATLGYEPQWLLLKVSSGASNWILIDNSRGFVAPGGGSSANLVPNDSASESTVGIKVNATGFTDPGVLVASGTVIYIAIRRGPMKTPTVGTSVYNAIARTGTGATANVTGVGFPVDLNWSHIRDAAYPNVMDDRLRGATYTLKPSTTDAEAVSSTVTSFAAMDGVQYGTGDRTNASGNTYINWYFKRAPGFFDEVCYTGDGANGRTVTTNLGVAAELIICKCRSNSGVSWFVAIPSISSGYLVLEGTAAIASVGTSYFASSSTNISFPVSASQNTNTYTFVAYLFATLAGVSKVGSYTGTGALLTVACGFTSGARFVLIKRTDSTGGWYMYDSVRGITSGNDPYLFANVDAVEVTSTNYVDTDTTGFKVTAAAPAGLNANGGTYIFLAIA